MVVSFLTVTLQCRIPNYIPVIVSKLMLSTNLCIRLLVLYGALVLFSNFPSARYLRTLQNLVVLHVRVQKCFRVLTMAFQVVSLGPSEALEAK